MTDLSNDARRVLTQAKAGQARASQALRARVKLQVERASTTEAPTPVESVRGVLTQPWLLPSGIVLVVLGGLALSAARQPTTSPPRIDRAATKLDSQPEQQEVASPPPPSAAEPSAEPPAAQPRPTESSARPARVDNVDDLRGEMQLLSRAEAALRAGDPQAALRALRTHAQKFRSGQLHEERDGLRLIALCTLGRDPGGMLSGYIAEHSNAVLYARVREACARSLP